MESKLTKLHIEAAAADNLNQLELANKKNECKTALNILLQEKASGLILQSKIKDCEEGEKSNSYFLNLVARNKVKKTMTKLMKSDNTFTTDTKEISLEQAKLFGHLYKTKSQKNIEEIETYLDKVKNVSLSKVEKLLCEGPLTEEESSETLKTFSTNKTPGNDGISFEFYQIFWNRLKILLVNSFNFLTKLSPSQRQAVITLIDKGKDIK